MPFPFRELSPTEIIPAAEQIIATLVYLEPVPEEAKLFELVNVVREHKNSVIDSLMKKRTGEFTEELGEAVELIHADFEIFRDTVKVRAKKITRARGRMVSSPESLACMKIVELITKHGSSISNLSRPALLGLLASLIEELQTEEFQEVITTGGVVEEFTYLSESYNSLKNLLHESSEKESAKNLIPSPGIARDMLARSLKKTYSFVRIFAEIGNEEYISILDKIEETLHKFRPLLNQSHKEHEEVLEEIDQILTVEEHDHPKEEEVL